ncbi:MAG: hypothetical protein WAV73_04835 [Candidatus Moraniibacteriota bacterium]
MAKNGVVEIYQQSNGGKKMAKIITKELIQKAIELTKPSAIAILQMEGATWGPKMVNGGVEAYGVKERVLYSFHGEDESAWWEPTWGKPKDFIHIADKKLGLVMKHQMNTSVLVALYPALLEDGDFLYSGGAYKKGIGGASASGAKGRADETIAQILLANINMLVQLEKDRRILADQMEI